jgi:hypothetical protein
MPSVLSLLPTIVIATVTTTVSVAAAMGGVQTLLPAAANNSGGAHVATVAPPAAHPHQQTGTLDSTPSSTAPPTPLAHASAEPSRASDTCPSKELPDQANGVGPRCQPGPPAAVPGKGDPAQGQGHATPTPEPAATPGNLPNEGNHGEPGLTAGHPTPAPHGSDRAPTH